MAKIDSNFKWLTYDEMAKNVAERALDEVLYDGKSIREWIQIIASEDCISRQAVIVALDDRMSSLENVDMQIAMGFAKGIIHELPPVSPQPKMGKWEKHDVRGQRVDCCSVCGLSNGTIYEYNYCPNCGAKMENEI